MRGYSQISVGNNVKSGGLVKTKILELELEGLDYKKKKKVLPFPLASCMTWGTLFLLSGLCLAYYQRFSERRDISDRLGVVREGCQQGVEMGLEKWVGS